MKKEKILETYTNSQICERLRKLEEEKDLDFGGYGNGFDRMGKVYFYQLLKYFPEYKEEILNLF